MSKVESESFDESSDEDYKPDEDEETCPKSEDDTDDNCEASDGEEKSRNRKKKPARSKKKLRKSQKEDDEDKEVVQETKEETAEEEKKRADALWADFLSDVDPPPAKKSKSDSQEENKTTSSSTESLQKTTDKKLQKDEEGDDKVKHTVKEKIFDFAGEEVRVPVMENPQKTTKQSTSVTTANLPRSSRGGVSGGLAAVLGSIGKKAKISTLEKSKLDWNQFKQAEGINEEIERFNKGKDGYLERQDFLERTDYRQFDIERDMRQKKRSSR